MSSQSFFHWFYRYQQQALMLNERRLVVLSGAERWAQVLLKTIVQPSDDKHQYNKNTWLIYGDGEYIQSNLSKQQFRDKLGTESHFVVVNVNGQNNEALSVDALTALSGTLIAGGILFLVVNDLLLLKKSLFYQRFFRLLATFSEHVVIEQENFSLPALPSKSIAPTPIASANTQQDHISNSLAENDNLFAYDCITQEQLKAVAAVIKVVKGKRNRPLVLTADRGRGKSSALAIACANLLKTATKANNIQLIITSADIGSLAIFFTQLRTSLPGGEWSKHNYSLEYGSVEFIAIDQLLKKPVMANLVLVDEAAAIPIYLLEQLLQHYSRLVFSSTIHGYEGAGRGFTLKFQQTLANKFPYWQSLHINEPIRWRANDPLEQLMFDACLLNAELPNVDNLAPTLASLVFKPISAIELAADERLFKQVFAVLVTAHYQTKPSDVQMLLDNAQVQLLCLLSEKNNKSEVVAVAFLMNEGQCQHNNISADDINAVSESQRRLKNHFTPQSLLTQCGVDYAFNFHYLRVMRIAVHPQLQHQGIGHYFLTKITAFSKQQGADFLAASFGATKALLSFWLHNNFQLARIGFNKDKASGEHSALVLKGLSQPGTKALEDINTEFYRCFDYLLSDEYQELNTELVMLILQLCPQTLLPLLSERDNANVSAFAKGHRQYSSCVFSLHLWLKHQLVNSAIVDSHTSKVFISRIMQKHSISNVCRDNEFTGKKSLEQYLKKAVSAHLVAKLTK